MNNPMPLAELIQKWAPGSQGPDWTWLDEVADLIERDRPAIQVMMLWPPEEPVSLGPDGRVWDGHHRIVAALLAGRTHIAWERVE